MSLKQHISNIIRKSSEIKSTLSSIVSCVRHTGAIVSFRLRALGGSGGFAIAWCIGSFQLRFHRRKQLTGIGLYNASVKEIFHNLIVFGLVLAVEAQIYGLSKPVRVH
jgi:hypothetical protein